LRWTGTYSGRPIRRCWLPTRRSNTRGFLNPVTGTFGWSLDPADQTLALTYTPSAVPEPGTLALVGLAAAAGWRFAAPADQVNKSRGERRGVSPTCLISQDTSAYTARRSPEQPANSLQRDSAHCFEPAMFRHAAALVVFLLFISGDSRPRLAGARRAGGFIFQNGDRVVFLGDSINRPVSVLDLHRACT